MEDPVPLEICPWWSGIYALHDVYRAGGEGNTSDNKVPAILSAYITEFGDCCLLMHVLDYTHIEGGSIAWCNWTGVGYRGGNRVSLYARDNEGWDLHFQKEVEVNNDEAEVLSTIYDQISERQSGGQLVAEFLLPYLPEADQLSIWDGVSNLNDPDGESLNQIRDSTLIAPLLGLDVIPLVQRYYGRTPWHRREQLNRPLTPRRWDS